MDKFPRTWGWGNAMWVWKRYFISLKWTMGKTYTFGQKVYSEAKDLLMTTIWDLALMDWLKYIKLNLAIIKIFGEKLRIKADYLKDQIIKRIDLDFIINGVDEKDKTFKETAAIETNVDIFLGLEDLSMTNCVGDIFIKDWFTIWFLFGLKGKRVITLWFVRRNFCKKFKNWWGKFLHKVWCFLWKGDKKRWINRRFTTPWC